MRKLVATAGLVALLGTLTALISPAAGAAPGTTCDGPLAPGTYKSVVVPDGAVCLSDGPITIRGGLQIGAGATFVLGSEESVGGTGTINGGINVQGGSGPFGGPFDITWNAIEDNTIHGGATVNGYNGFWFGFIRNSVSGSVSLTNNVLEDTDGNEYVTNTIRGSLNCSGNVPAAQIGDSEGSPNVVTGQKSGECAGV
jgi:hypothetical protein